MVWLAITAGCLTIYYCVFALLHWAVAKRLTANRYASNIGAALAAYPVSIGLTGYERTEYLGLYLAPGLIVLGLAVLRARKVDRDGRAAAVDAFR